MAETLPATIEPYPKISFKLYTERFRAVFCCRRRPGGSGSHRGPERQRLPRAPGGSGSHRADPRDA
jgi:hypothetical protein